MAGQPAASRPGSQRALLTELCVHFSVQPAGLCPLLSPESDSSSNFGSRTAALGPKHGIFILGHFCTGQTYRRSRRLACSVYSF